MRNMSFALTTAQVRGRRKRVTRRAGIGWLKLKPGELIQAVEKSQGIKKGQRVVKVAVLRVVSVRQEYLNEMADVEYGHEECIAEGFPDMQPYEFIEMFCKTHKGVSPSSLVTRIEFDYVETT